MPNTTLQKYLLTNKSGLWNVMLAWEGWYPIINYGFLGLSTA